MALLSTKPPGDNADENDCHTQIERSGFESLGCDCNDWPIGRLVSTIASCVVEGSGVGAIRRMDLARGGKIVDHIVDIQPGRCG